MAISGGPYSNEERKLIDDGVQICAQEPYSDAGELAANAAKAEYAEPIGILAEGTYQRIAPEKKKMHCINYYDELSKSKPGAFSHFEGKNREYLADRRSRHRD
jgi:hypothetical protein